MVISLLTDYGRDDDFVGVCHGVIRTIHPDAAIIDLTHSIPRHDVRQAALTLANALAYLPVGVHVAVVDPQVGTERRALALRCEDGRLLVGPDNGVLSLAWERAGGVALAVDVSRSPHRLEPVSATFHGRDLFAPVAARLATGADVRDAGDPLDPAELATIELPEPRWEGDAAVGNVVAIDRFGNVVLDLTHQHLLELGLTLGTRVAVSVGHRRREATFVQTFADVPPGELLVYEDAWGAVAVAMNRGDAARELEAERDHWVRIERT